MKNFFKSWLIFVLFLTLFISPFLGINKTKAQEGVDKLANPIGGVFSPEASTEAEKQKQREGDTDINVTLKRVIDTVLGVLGSITLLVFVFGGLMWLTSGGNEQKVDKGTKTMLYAAIGVFVIFSAYAILNALIGVLSGS